MKDLRYDLFILAVLAVAVIPSISSAQSNTGTIGPPDTNYNVIAPPPLGVPPGAPQSLPPYPGWVTSSPASNWDSPWNYYNFNAPGGPLPYDYQTTFNLGGQFLIQGRMAADNGACLWANSVYLGLGNCTPNPGGFKWYTHFTIPTSNTLGGVNTVDFKVTNLSFVTGLRVEFFCTPPAGYNLVSYVDGPANGTVNAWTINFGFVVSDTFQTSGATISGFCLYLWVPSGALPLSVEASVTSGENGGTTYFDGVVPLTCAVYCKANDPQQKPVYGSVCGGTSGTAYDVYACTGPMAFPIAAGTWWLNLQNGVTNTGDPLFWDQASGPLCPGSDCPSSASENTIGTIPPEAFDIF
ncbi:MAG: hypothetical protein ABSD98_12310 [Candidatus Korobacteraceae bacterium]